MTYTDPGMDPDVIHVCARCEAEHQSEIAAYRCCESKPAVSVAAEAYALRMVLVGAESFIEDDTDEDHELTREQHTRAREFGYSLLHAIRYHQSQLLTTAREHHAVPASHQARLAEEA